MNIRKPLAILAAGIALALLLGAAFVAGSLFESYGRNERARAETALRDTRLDSCFAPAFALSGLTGSRDSFEMTAFVVEGGSNRKALLTACSAQAGWHRGQVTAEEFVSFSDAAFWPFARMLGGPRVDAFDAWYYRENAAPAGTETALASGCFAEIGRLGRGFSFAVYDSDTGLFIYVRQFG